jgi:hypothetical protein
MTDGPENHFSVAAGGTYDPSVVTGMPTWREVRLLVARELGERVYGSEPLVPERQSGMTWAARAQRTGPIVVKVRHGDRADEKTRWCVAHLPALGARGYPVPAILWHGMISAQWHVTVQNRLPRCPWRLRCGAGSGVAFELSDSSASMTTSIPHPAGRQTWPCAA